MIDNDNEIKPAIGLDGQVLYGWFSLYSSGGTLEYNTGENPTARLQSDRQPLAQIFRHISGKKVVAIINGHSTKDFSYRDYDYNAALDAAILHVENHFKQMSLHSDDAPGMS